MGKNKGNKRGGRIHRDNHGKSSHRQHARMGEDVDFGDEDVKRRNEEIEYCQSVGDSAGSSVPKNPLAGIKLRMWDFQQCDP
eukprot:CAMPEP_0176017048 /NCGR_PEP_ID=MMETSP0120_2-20121206/8162_1 /TAXON_ID=160619 /ORGANISM="Kryptoperidinium foliaceum, Strain CCMP 1326" /LENGTH=81 /DNA_ID=CAMNT_0017350057 /DNA_START=110 /DNA_END=351 /DNA_ORIENTATION=-